MNIFTYPFEFFVGLIADLVNIPLVLSVMGALALFCLIHLVTSLWRRKE